MKILTMMLFCGTLVALTACTTATSTTNRNNLLSKIQSNQFMTYEDRIIQSSAITRLLALDSRFAISRVNVNSFNGYVLLTGQVLDQHLREIAEKSIKNTQGVQVVHNFLTVEPQISYEQIQIDQALLSRANQLISGHATLKNSKLAVYAENNVLYVMGRVNVAENIALTDVLSQAQASKVILLVDNIEMSNTTVSTSNTASTTTQISTTVLPTVSKNTTK